MNAKIHFVVGEIHFVSAYIEPRSNPSIVAKSQFWLVKSKRKAAEIPNFVGYIPRFGGSNVCAVLSLVPQAHSLEEKGMTLTERLAK